MPDEEIEEHDADEHEEHQPDSSDAHSVDVISVVWKAQVMGLAFIEGSILHFGEVVDTGPDFVQLQTVKYTLKPTVIVTPASSDQTWLSILRASELIQPGQPQQVDEGDDDGLPIDEDAYTVILAKARDFTIEAAFKRLSLMRGLTDLSGRDAADRGGRELSEREILLYVQGIIPQDCQQALRAIGGLLSHFQKSEEASSTRVSEIRRYEVGHQLFLAPEAYLSLNIFEDARHPSAHGGRSKEGFSVWALMNRAKSKPGMQLLRSWFARPTQHLDTLRSRFDAIDFFVQQHAMLPQLQEQLAKTKDVTKIDLSVARGGLMLSDYTNILNTASCAVKIRSMLHSADTPKELPIMARVRQRISQKLVEVADMIAGVIDFESSRAGAKLAAGAAKHICVVSMPCLNLNKRLRTPRMLLRVSCVCAAEWM